MEVLCLVVLLFINITCGIALLSVASPILQETTGMTALAAASIVGVRACLTAAADYFGQHCLTILAAMWYIRRSLCWKLSPCWF